MYRVMIVEDEMLVRLGLKNSIEWSKFDMTVTADAADGQTAWDIYLKDRPDLVITDLKMPGMDGMELITKIREKDKSTEIIILSCLEEFDLVRKAMSYGVSDYILKLTMTEEEMEAVLEKAKNELDQQKNKNPGVSSVYQLSKEVVKEKFLKDFLFYNIYSVNELTAFVNESNLRMNPGHLILCNMEIDHFETLQSRFNDGKGQLVKSSMLNILDEILGSHSRGEVFSDSDINYILIFSFHDLSSEQDIYNELYSILNNIRSSISTFLNIYVSFGISGLYNGYHSLMKMYKETLGALENKFFQGAGIFLSQSRTEDGSLGVNKVNALCGQAKIMKILGESGTKDFCAKIEAFSELQPKSKKQIQLFFCGLLQFFAAFLHSMDNSISDILLMYNDKIQKGETLDEVIDSFNGFIAEIAGITMKKDILSREIALALRFIQQNYKQDINLPQVADYVKLSPNYLGALFKKELKINFNEYLNELRIEKAKELLVGTYLKSYEVAEKVGFTEHTYFSKVFKKLVGVSPNEFRKSLMREWSEEMENEPKGDL